MTGIYKYILVRRAAAYSIPYLVIIIYQVQVICCETAYGVYIKRGTTATTTQSSSSGTVCI